MTHTRAISRFYNQQNDTYKNNEQNDTKQNNTQQNDTNTPRRMTISRITHTRAISRFYNEHLINTQDYGAQWHENQENDAHERSFKKNDTQEKPPRRKTLRKGF